MIPQWKIRPPLIKGTSPNLGACFVIIGYIMLQTSDLIAIANNMKKILLSEWT